MIDTVIDDRVIIITDIDMIEASYIDPEFRRITAPAMVSIKPN